MTTYAWGNFPVNRFEMRILPNIRTFVGPYTPTTQALDLLGSRWQIVMTLPPTVQDDVTGAALEAFWDRLKGQTNLVTLWHLARPLPQGTLRGAVNASWTGSGGAATWTGSGGAANWTTGAPTVYSDIAQLSNTAVIQTVNGNTLLAGDHLNLGTQLVRIMANATADSNGLMSIEFQPRARTLIPAGTGITYASPSANFMLKPGISNVPTAWTPDMVEGSSIEFLEVF